MQQLDRCNRLALRFAMQQQERELQLVSCGKKLRMVEEAMESTLTCMSCMSVTAWRCAASSQTTRPSACYFTVSSEDVTVH